jgi:segregation and condensation protein B
MTPEQIVEATLFASQTPLTPAELARADERLDVARVRDALLALRERYDEEEHAFQLYQLGDGYQLLTRPEYAPYLERFDSVARPPALSRAGLETLAIIAYRQPIGRLEIEEIRGVVSTTVLRTLQDWELIGVVGRGEGLGRPMLYGTTQSFLDHFGFQDLTELPRPQDLPVALRGSEVSVEGEVTHASDVEPPNGRGQSQDAPRSSGNGSRPTAQGSA